MIVYVARRLGQALVTLWLVSLLVFLLGSILGDPVTQMLPPSATQEEREALRAVLGYDRPVAERYADYTLDALRGDLGESSIYQRPARELVMERLPMSVLIGSLSVAIALVVGVPLGMVAGARPGTLWDRLSVAVATGGQVVPTFVVAIVLTELLAVRLSVFPVAGTGTWRHAVLPSLALAFWVMAAMTRLTRSSMRETLTKPFIMMATAKGIGRRRVILGHAARHAQIPVVTYGGMQLGTLLSGAVVVESLYAIPGLGKLAIDAVQGRDFILVQACVLASAALYILVTLLIDLTYSVIDPRVRAAA